MILHHLFDGDLRPCWHFSLHFLSDLGIPETFNSTRPWHWAEGPKRKLIWTNHPFSGPMVRFRECRCLFRDIVNLKNAPGWCRSILFGREGQKQHDGMWFEFPLNLASNNNYSILPGFIYSCTICTTRLLASVPWWRLEGPFFCEQQSFLCWLLDTLT